MNSYYIAHVVLLVKVQSVTAGSELSAMVYGEYFPNPAIARSLQPHWPAASVSLLQATPAEGSEQPVGRSSSSR